MPRAREIRSRMLRLFLFHLLGSWLLLSQLPRESRGQDMEIFTKCNLELVRFYIHVCGTHIWAEDMRKQRKPRSGPSTGESCWSLKIWIVPFITCFSSKGLTRDLTRARENYGNSKQLYLRGMPFTSWQQGRLGGEKGIATEEIRLPKDP